MRAGAKCPGASNALLNYMKEAPNRVKSTLVRDCHLSDQGSLVVRYTYDDAHFDCWAAFKP